jgi:hypothetical protein
MDGYNVAPDEVDRHVTAVDNIVGGVQTASDTARDIGMGGVSPYGVFCAPLWGVLQITNADSNDVTATAAALGHALVDALRTTRDSYQDFEDQARDLMREME